MPRSRARRPAMASISALRSTPTSCTSRGYEAKFSPVPTPSSSVRPRATEQIVSDRVPSSTSVRSSRMNPPPAREVPADPLLVAYEPRRQLLAAHRTADEVALRAYGPERSEEAPRPLVLDTLGDERERHRLRERRSSAHDDRGALACHRRGHERPIDLDLIDRQVVQVGERGGARPEVGGRDGGGGRPG